jgi:hypothetical protein
MKRRQDWQRLDCTNEDHACDEKQAILKVINLQKRKGGAPNCSNDERTPPEECFAR